VLGNEASNDRLWQGTLRLVAIYNRALTQAQIQQNFDAGVGEKFFLLFGVGGVGGVPANSYIMFQVEQFDSYSYLFSKPTFINLDPGVTPDGIAIKDMRIGINSKVPDVGQAYANLDTTVTATNYDPATGEPLSDVGTVIALENGPNASNADEFYLTFETLGTANNIVVDNPNTSPTPLPDPGTVSKIGLRTFDEIDATMASITGVDVLDPDNVQPPFVALRQTFQTLRQALPAVETIQGFLAAQQMSISQLALGYCNVLVDDTGLRSSFFGPYGFNGFDSDVATAFGSGDSTAKNQVVDALYNQMVGLPGSGTALGDAPTRDQIKIELFGYDGGGTPQGNNSLFDRMTGANCGACDAARTRAILKGMCGAVLGSAAMLVQ
jgi:hypothetical protein